MLHNARSRADRGATLYRDGPPPQVVPTQPAVAPPSRDVLRFPDAVRAEDPHFSGALFRDHALLVYTRACALLFDASAEAMLRTLLTPGAERSLRDSLLGWRSVGLVTLGHHTVEVERRAGALVLVVTFLGNLTVEPPDGSERVLLDREERWVFARPAGARSPKPERLRVLGCIGCGSTADPGLDGRCPACGGPRVEGAPQWRVIEVDVLFSERAPPLSLMLGGGPEPGLERPTARHPQLRARRRALEARHPHLDLDRELERVAAVFVQLQEAWTRGTWEVARPWMSDALFTANQGWLEQLARAGLRNRTVGVKVSKVELCDVAVDAWVEVLTVRIFASCLDWTERLDGGGVEGGSARERRVFSEYWTFMRSVGATARSPELDGCPSCGAPLEGMQMSGVCRFCESKVSDGRFDWVATRISQDDDVESFG